MTIYAYENRPHRRITIHDGRCGNCKDGEGQRGTGPTDNGGWSGPYATVTEAKQAVTGRQPTIRVCKACLP